MKSPVEMMSPFVHTTLKMPDRNRPPVERSWLLSQPISGIWPTPGLPNAVSWRKRRKWPTKALPSGFRHRDWAARTGRKPSVANSSTTRAESMKAYLADTSARPAVANTDGARSRTCSRVSGRAFGPTLFRVSSLSLAMVMIL